SISRARSYLSKLGKLWYNRHIVQLLDSREETLMALTVEAVYENGTLRLTNPLPLKEQEKVRVTIELALTWAERTAGMLQWKGDTEELRKIIEDDELSILESS